MRALASAVVLALLLPGCTFPPRDDPSGGGLTQPPTTPPTPVGPPLVFGGTVRDAVSGALLAEGSVRVDLAQEQPCGRQGVGWSSWEPAFANGTWGPLELPRPRSGDVAFFVHAYAPGFSENATFIGPAEARAGVSDLTLLLHPDAAIEGSAPPGTLVALDAPSFPRVGVADASGRFAFPHARAVDAHLVAATDVPYRALVRAPANVSVPVAEGRGWVLEGSVKGPSGAPLAADVVAWNGTRLASVARAGPSGVFALPLAAEPVDLRLEARTADGRFGGIRSVGVDGPPALRETVLLAARC